MTWNLNTPVVTLRDIQRQTHHDWTIRDALEGVQVFGATGSGKTSGSGRAIASGLLRAGFGGLVLTAKPTDAEDWANPADGYMALADRLDRPIVVGPKVRWPLYESWGVEVPTGGHRLNFLDYEYRRLRRAGVNPSFNLVALFDAALEAGRPDAPRSSSEPFWDDTFRQMLQHAIDLCAMAHDAVSLPRIKDIVLTAPMSREEADSRLWREQRGACWECLELAQARFDADKPVEHYDAEDFRQTATYWLKDLAGLAWKTRSNILTTFTSKVDGLLRSPLRQILCPSVGFGSEGSDATFPPDLSHQGRVIILDFPIKSFGETGRFAQVLYKTLWQLATEDRDVLIDNNWDQIEREAPAFLWADESQYFVTKRDMQFQLTARSKAVATVYLTQDLSNYYVMLKGQDSRAAADSLVGNLQTKIFHANGDPVTNEWAQRVFGVGAVRRVSRTNTMGEVSRQRAEHLEPLVAAKSFATLNKGGPVSNGSVGAYVFQAGRVWGDEPERGHVLRAEFSQTE